MKYINFTILLVCALSPQTEKGHKETKTELATTESTLICTNVTIASRSCAYPESFVRGGPTLQFLLGFFVGFFGCCFLVNDGREDPNIINSGSSSFNGVCWRADYCPTLNDDLVVF